MKPILYICALLICGCYAKETRIIIYSGVPGYECAKLWALASIEKNNGRMEKAIDYYTQLIECDRTLSTQRYPYAYYDLIVCNLALLRPDSALAIRHIAIDHGLGNLIRSLDSILPPVQYEYSSILGNYVPYAKPPAPFYYHRYFFRNYEVVTTTPKDSFYIFPYEADSLGWVGRVTLTIYFDEQLNILYIDLLNLVGDYLFAATANYSINEAQWQKRYDQYTLKLLADSVLTEKAGFSAQEVYFGYPRK